MALAAVIFLITQGVSHAHAAEHGGMDHNHDGIACDLMIVAAEQIVVTPPLPVASPTFHEIPANWDMRIIAVLPRNFDGRAPPPRAPPTH